MRTHDLRTLAFLQFILVKSWLRRSVRSPFFWFIIVALGFLVVSVVATMLGSGPGDDLSHWLASGYFEAGVITTLVGATLIGTWRGASSAPRASLADIVMLMGSPLSSRAHYAYLMIRDFASNGLIIALWVTAGFGGVLVQTGDQLMPLRVFFLLLVAIGFMEMLRYAIWVTTERVIVRNPLRGSRIRKGIRLGVVLATGALAGYLVPPILDGATGGWLDGLETLANRAGDAAVIPPLSWGAGVILGDGPVLFYLVGLIALPAVTAVFALIKAEDFIEPIAINAERVTDAKGAMTDPGADVQWAAMAQFGIAPRAKFTLPPFGRGPWALLWASLVRWARYELAAGWIGLVILGGFGVVMAIAIRTDLVPVYAGWALVLVIPLFGSANAFMDELRKQFLYLTPGPAWKRLLAGAVTSVMDGLVASLMVIVALALFGTLSVAAIVGLVVFTAALSIVSQAAVALVQVVLPYWIPQRIRIGVTIGAATVGAIPAAMVMIVVYLGTSVIPAMLIGSIVAIVSGAVMLALASLFFDRIEFSG